VTDENLEKRKREREEYREDVREKNSETGICFDGILFQGESSSHSRTKYRNKKIIIKRNTK
jgi:hypothetical protein